MNDQIAASTAPATEEWPVGIDRFWQPQRLAFWVFALLFANGVFLITNVMYSDAQIVPTAVLVSIVIWTLFAIPLFIFYRYMDFFEQSSWLGIGIALGWGGFVATYLALPANGAIFSILSKAIDPEFAHRWGAAIAGPTSEELLKYLGVIVLVLIAKTQFRSILSAMAMGALVGLGFQIIEDMIYSINNALTAESAEEVGPAASLLLVRGVLSGFWSHPLYTTVTAFGIGYVLTRPHESLAKRLLVAAGAFAIGWFLHFFWNSPLVIDWASNPALIFAVVIGKGLLILIVAAVMWRFASREESGDLQAIAEYYVSEDLITADERGRLGKLRDRRHYRKDIQHEYGRAAGKASKNLQRAQMRLIMAMAETGPNSERTEEQAAVVRRFRNDLNTAITASSA